MGRQQIPVVVLAGFLGSGKTTLLNQLLWRSRGTRIGAVVNDFGAIEIDAMTVAGQVGSTVSLGNGCLCCAVDVAELDTYLERLTRPEAGLDVIVIEASGLAEPVELVRMILASENPHIRYGGLVEVVDAAEYEATRERHPELDRHLAAADLVVLNKTDRVTPAELAELLTAVRARAGDGAVTPASYGRIDPELLFDRRPQTERYGQLSFDDAREEDEPGAAARTTTITTATCTPPTTAPRSPPAPRSTRAGSWTSSTAGPKGSTASRGSSTSARSTPATSTPCTPSAASCGSPRAPGSPARNAAPSSS